MGVGFAVLIVFTTLRTWADFPLNGNPFVWIKAHDLYAEGQKARQHFDMETAYRKYKEATSVYDRDSQFWLAYGLCQLRLHDYAGAEASLLQSTKWNERNINAWRQLSYAYAMGNNAEEAIKAIHKALDLSPSDPAATAQLGLLLASAGEMKEAANIFDQSRRLERDNAEYWNLTGRYFKLLGKPQETEAAFRQAVSQDPTEPEYSEWLGLCLQSEGHYDEAEGYLAKAARMDKSNASYWASLSETQMNQNHTNSALESLQKAISLDPQNFDWQYNYAMILFDNQRYAEAEKAFADVLKRRYEPDTANYYLKALVYQNKFDAAAIYLRERINKNGDRANYNDLVCLGDVLAVQGKRDDAIAVYKKVLEYKLNDGSRREIEAKIKNPPQLDRGGNDNQQKDTTAKPDQSTQPASDN
jgi:tetratricopeptide (TPR) repeat protein